MPAQAVGEVKRYQQGNEGEQRAKKKAAQEVEQPSHTQGIAERAISGPAARASGLQPGSSLSCPGNWGKKNAAGRRMRVAVPAEKSASTAQQPPPYRRDQVDTALLPFVETRCDYRSDRACFAQARQSRPPGV